MAGGAKLSARQKMINLMYLIFIAMLALNMSKEVLSAFGLMNEKLASSNEAAEARNKGFMSNLDTKANEAPEKYKPLKSKADQINALATKFDTYLTDLKSQMTSTVDNPEDYEVMDKADFLDNMFFNGDKLKPEGQEFVKQFNDFRDGVSKILGNDKRFTTIKQDLAKQFSTGKVTNRDGQEIDWIDYNYKGFPMVASLTKLTQVQADVKTTVSETLGAMLQSALAAEVSMDNYTTLLESSKSAYFNGEKFDGQIVLGRKDGSTKPNKVELTLDGRPLVQDKDFTIENGRVKLNLNAGRPGEHKIEGKLIFMQDGETMEVPVSSNFATVPKPNSATISADKMNVVYRGVTNPMTISFAGVPDNKVTATAPGLKRSNGSKYTMRPGQGKEVTINVTGTLPDGQKVSDKAKFRIKDIPKPTGTVSGQDGSVKLPRNSVEIAKVGAKLDDFDFELPIQVTSFKMKVPGQPTVTVQGTRLNSRAKGVLRKAKRGAAVTFFDIKAKIKGNSSYRLKKVSPVMVEIAN